MTNTVEIIETGLRTYEGLTKQEKDYGLSHLDEWIPENGRLNILIEKYAEKSLDIRPFLEQSGLLNQE
jgi:hypothetical protein